MLLTKLAIENLKCHENLILTDIQKLCVVIGENDAGKTVILDAIELLLNANSCRIEEFRELEEGSATEIRITGDFLLDHTDTIPEHLRADANHFRLTKVCRISSTEYFIDGEGYDDEYANMFSAATVLVKQDILTRLGVERPARIKAELQVQFDELLEEGVFNKAIRTISISYAELRPYLPRVERFFSSDYADPQSIIQRGLKTVALATMKPLDASTGEHIEVEELQKVRRAIIDALDAEIAEATATIQHILPSLENVSIIPTIDFGNALQSVQLAINAGSGKRSSTSFGQGTNRRLWLGLLDWQRKVERENAVGGIIYLYDEPETNLHYSAQQQLFKNISDRSNESVQVQSFVCTHSIHLIDRAPADTIRLLEGTGSSQRHVRRIAGETAENMRAFFDRIGRNLGLSNTALLYEKAFLVVEGPTEDEALPILYSTLYGNTLEEDGIVLVNLYSCGAWPTAMKILLRNRQDFVHMLLDQDCSSPNSSADITLERLIEEGCNASFLTDQITLIGTKEYEDAFSDETIAESINNSYPRADGRAWTEADVCALRAEEKFSSALQKLLKTNCELPLRSKATKPRIAVAVANNCIPAQIPQEVKTVFALLRRRAGLEPTTPSASELTSMQSPDSEAFETPYDNSSKA